MGQNNNSSGKYSSINKGAGARQSDPATLHIRGDGARASGSRPPHPPKK